MFYYQACTSLGYNINQDLIFNSEFMMRKLSSEERPEVWLLESFYFANMKSHLCQVIEFPFCTGTLDCISLGGTIAWKYIFIFTFRNLPHLCSQFTGYGADFWQLTFIDCADVKIVFVLFIPYEAAKYYRSNIASLYLHSYSSCPLYGSKLRCLEYSDLICNDSRRGERETGNTEYSEFNNEK